MHPFTNRLINEDSPYLLQHAHNPVDWYPWGSEAFEKAKKENKPVLVSIGYAACHWCHVMERESFEDPEVAAVMNRHFVNIKVDREERPDVDHIYMDAVQAMTGSGGWPLNVFLTDEGKPFYGGTYFPPRRAFNRASWTEVLQAISQAYTEQRNEIEVQANNLTGHLKGTHLIGQANDTFMFSRNLIDTAYENIMKSADKQWGGFGRAPKFPQSFTITFLLRYASITGNNKALLQATLSLDKMIQGGIYDQVGGGFARYSTDTEWLVPHFEKMLYDNALLVWALAEAFQRTHKEVYREVIGETLAFVEREMMHGQGGFFSALDADSEGEEGKFYVWDYDEVENILGTDMFLFSAYFDISKAGNWEGKNILHVPFPLKEFAERHNLQTGELKKLIEKGKSKLLEERSKRTRPSLDDKVILSWNALMNTAFSKAYAATGEERYKETAVKNMKFLLQAYASESGGLYHTWKNGQAKHPAFLDDYSFLIHALIQLYQVTADRTWLKKAQDTTAYVIEHFSDRDSGLFFYTHALQTDVLLRKKEVYDTAIPSGNSIMAFNLYLLSVINDEHPWRTKAAKMVTAFGDIAIKYPTSFGLWLSVLFEMVYGTNEIAIIGQDFHSFLKKVLAVYLPHSIIMASKSEDNDYPLLRSRSGNGETLIYLCKNYSCLKPVNTVEDFKMLLSEPTGDK